MKLNRFFGLAVIALLAVGGLGLTSDHSAANVQAAHPQQVQVTSAAPNTETPGSEEVASGPDTDNIQQQVGDQSGSQVEDGLPDSPAAPAQQGASPNLQAPGNSSGPTTQGMSSGPGVASPASPARVTFLNAKAAAPASTSIAPQSSINTQSGQQVADGQPDGAEISGSEEVVSGPDTDNIQQQVGDQSGSQVEDGLPDTGAASGQ
jgi:hypothetical protein